MTGTQLFIALLVAVGGASALFLIWQVDPAWTISAGLGLTMFAGDWQLWGLPAFIAPDRLLLATGVLAVIARAPGARHRRPVLFRPVHWLLLVVLAYGACSLLVGTASGQSLNSGSIFHWLDRLGFMPFLVFLVAPVVFQTSRQRTILLATLGLMGAYLGLTALFETVGPHALVFPSYILDPSVGIHSGRARGPFLEAVANGIGLYAGAVAAVIIATTAKRQFWRWAGILVAILCCLGIVFTLQRGIWLGAIVATLAAMLAMPKARRWIAPGFVSGVILVVVTLALIPGLSQSAAAREGDQRPIWDRKNLNAAALRMIADQPLQGFGLGSFASASPPYFKQATDYPLTGVGLELHNVFLSNTVELGVPVAGLWLFAVVVALGTAVAQRGPPELYPWRIGFIAIFVQWLIVANTAPLAQVFPNLLLWTWGGVLWGHQALSTCQNGGGGDERSQTIEARRA